MCSSWYRFFCACALVVGLANCQKRVFHSEPHIIGGESPATESPLRKATVGLWSEGERQIFCSGVLVAPDVVLTAAHCMEGQEPGSLRVVFERFVSGKIEPAQVAVREFRKFKDDPRLLAPNFDVAWVRLAAAAPRGFSPVEIISTEDLEPGEAVTVAGFGKTSTNCEPGAPDCSGRLLTTETRFSRTLDSALFFDLVLLGPTSGHSACNGDSGGPAFVMRQGQPRLLGVAQGFFGPLTPRSFPDGELRCEAGQVLYTAVDDYVGWLKGSGLQVSGGKTNRVSEVGRRASLPFEASIQDWARYDNHTDENWYSLFEIAKAAVVTLSLEEQGRILTSETALADHLGKLRQIELTGHSFEGKRFLRKISPLGAMSSLEKVVLMGHRLQDLNPLSRLHGLRSLAVTHNFDAQTGSFFTFSLKPLERAEALAELDLSFNSPPGNAAGFPLRFEELGGVASLRKLSVVESGVGSLSGIESLGALETLVVVDAVRPGKPRDLAFLAPLRQLRSLTLSGGALLHYERLSEMQALTHLELQRAGLSELAPLSSLHRLETLVLSENPIRELTPLFSLPLRKLDLMGTGLSPEACRGFGERAGICGF